MSRLVSRSGRDVDGRIRHQQQPVIGRHVQHEHVAHAPAGAQALGRDRRLHQFVGVQAAFHQCRDLAGARHRDGLARRRRGCARSRRSAWRQARPAALQRLLDLRLGPDQDRVDQPALAARCARLRRFRIARMDDGAADARQILAHGHEPRQQIGFAIELSRTMHRRPRMQRGPSC
jgi:hypothetical protein